MKIKSCRPYHAVLDSVEAVNPLGDPSAFKIYYVSIVGRDHPERYEWARRDLAKVDFKSAFLERGFEGIGFVTAFPHITKVFRFSPHSETVLDIAVFDTDGLTPRGVDRGDGFLEFACYAEAAIAAEEYRAWAEADTVDDYLSFVCGLKDFPVARSDKLAAFFHLNP